MFLNAVGLPFGGGHYNFADFKLKSFLIQLRNKQE